MDDLTIHARNAIEAFNKGDWAGVTTYFGGSTYKEFGTRRTIEGTDAILEALQAWRSAMPDVQGTITSSAQEGSLVVLEIMWEGTQTGELVTEEGIIPATGKHQSTPAVFVFQYRDGQLWESRHYFDMLTYLKQVSPA
jgi:steroid delta-isomerase-like uncharacterized protein